MTDKIYSIDLKTLRASNPAVFVLTAFNTEINQETNTIKVVVGDIEIEINIEPISEFITNYKLKESVLQIADVEDMLLKLRGKITKLISEKIDNVDLRVAVPVYEAIKLLALVIQQYRPDILEYSIGKCIYKYSIKAGAWIMRAAVDFTVQGKEIKAGTIGGKVDNPYHIHDSWIEEGSIVEGACTFIDNSYVSSNSRVGSSYIKDSTVDNSAVFYSCLYKTSIMNDSNIDKVTAAALATSNTRLYKALVYHYTPICGFKAVGDVANPLVLSYYKEVNYLPVVAIGVGTEDNIMTVGRGARNWDISINRGCFHGNLADFKARIDKDIDRSALESEKYYAMVEYLALKVAEKRSDYLKPAMRELLKVYDNWLASVNDKTVFPVYLLPYIDVDVNVDNKVTRIMKKLMGEDE